MAGKEPKPEHDQVLRSDARRNGEKIRQAAIEVFREHGIDAPMEAVVRRAGISTATLYNHFRNRRNLIDSVAPSLVSLGVETVTRRAMRSPDPWERFVRLVMGLCEYQAADPKFSDVIARRFVETGRIDQLCEKARGGAEAIITEAQSAGVLRDDITGEDIVLFVLGINSMIVRACAQVAPDAWRRYIGVVIDGLRADGIDKLGADPIDAELTFTLIRRLSAPRSVV
ncbi:TetR/AcrR family transcriptional regulator [Glycomyces sp. L485]|uniref:TetR/AcrR family transcriptional regulator n=1 Tax=Glycomyces sp. L485 TaxID=2909235 RepID=UPI001F4A6A41|nr:TetR/AcrR family transcriptional regulator [Glycomyces sp. L485]MCH7231635.1 TetR/AcrR family transcriptional regulator [Glycomyces sp. L485]